MIGSEKVKFRYSKSVIKFFEKQQQVRDRFKRNIVAKYESDAKNLDIKKMAGYEDLYRMRIGDFRVIYKVQENQIVIVDVLLAGSRGDIYKKF